MIELLAGILLGIGVGATAMWIREKQQYIRYVQEQSRRYSEMTKRAANSGHAWTTGRFQPGDDQ